MSLRKEVFTIRPSILKDSSEEMSLVMFYTSNPSPYIRASLGGSRRVVICVNLILRANIYVTSAQFPIPQANIGGMYFPGKTFPFV